MFLREKSKYTNAEASEVFSTSNYYAILGVLPKCSEDDIKRAYRSLAREYHPDKNRGMDTGVFSSISTAYKILSDPTKRKDYDKYRIHCGSNTMDSFLSSVGRAKSTKRKRKTKQKDYEREKKEGCTNSPTFENGNTNNFQEESREEQTGERSSKRGRNFQHLFNATTKEDTRVYDGAPEINTMSVLIGIVKNIKGGTLKVPFKSIHHKEIAKSLDQDKISMQERETSLETNRGDLLMRKEKQIFYEDVHEIHLAPLEKYPKVVVLSGAGSSIGINQKKYKCRADLKITIDFSPTFLGDNEQIPVGLWKYFDNSCQYLPEPPKQMTRNKVCIFGKDQKLSFFSNGRMPLGFIDCIEQKYYSSKIGELDVLTINLPIKSHHINESGFCAFLELLDGREILLRYTKKELIKMMKRHKKIFDHGPAVPHLIVREGGYSYRVTDKTIQLVKIGRSPLVVIFTMTL